MKLFVDKELDCVCQLVTLSCVLKDSWTVEKSRLHDAVCRKRAELWMTVGYMKQCVVRELNCG
jgi:hypothetical protein